MTTHQTSRHIGPVSSMLLGIVGTVVSVLVTIQLKKMLEARSLPERTSDLKAALKGAGANAVDLKQAAAAWIEAKAQATADRAHRAATATADKVVDVAQTVKEQTNG